MGGVKRALKVVVFVAVAARIAVFFGWAVWELWRTAPGAVRSGIPALVVYPLSAGLTIFLPVITVAVGRGVWADMR